MDIYRQYAQQINSINNGKPHIVGLKSSISKWINQHKSTLLTEIFQINHGDSLRNDLIQFLQSEFQKGNIRAIHAGLSSTEYHTKDWLEDIADNLINRLLQYFETIRGQTERDDKSKIPLEKN